MELPPGKSLILFDGYCHLCNGTVKFILRFDRRKKFIFSPLTSPTGIYFEENLSIPKELDSIILIEKDIYYSKAEASLKIAKKLGGIFHIALIFYGVPKKYRNRLYDWIAKNRYRWFGKYNKCMIPNPEYIDRFI